MGEWYYIGHYGQLGPLTREQIDELIEGGVIVRDTYIWRSGMSDWLPAERVTELQSSFSAVAPFAAPPPPPMSPRPNLQAPVTPAPYYQQQISPAYSSLPLASGLRSDRNRVMAGVLNLLLPGVGRMYLGYAAIGVLQLVLAACTGVGIVWSWVDGIIILSGGVRFDGYGRNLGD